MRRILLSGALIAAVAVFMIVAGGSKSGSTERGKTYKIELDNAFGLVKGADFKVAGVPAGKIQNIDLEPGCIQGITTQCYALITVQVTQGGFGSFHSNAFCESRPQSLIGEYFIECQPGTKGRVIPSGGTIPVRDTQTTIPADLLLDVMRMPYRERLGFIINELGAAVAGRSGDLQAALQRAVPALSETDNLLNLLGNDSQTLQSLTVNSDTVLRALANNTKTVQNFIDEANKAATASATQQQNIAASVHQLPGFLEQLKPTMSQLGTATDANLPAVQELNRDSSQLNALLTNLPGFANASKPAIKALGQASVTGKTAVQAATPTVNHLNQFSKPTPELAQNLNIVLHDLDSRSRAVEPNAESPGGKGYTGLEAILQYAFNQALVTNTLSPLGHIFNVDLFYDSICSSYASPQTVADNLATYGSQARRCYAFVGPNQPGINEPDPSDPSACVPDPGGAPPGKAGPTAPVCKLSASSTTSGTPTGLALAKDKKSAKASSAAKSSSASSSTSKTTNQSSSGSSNATSASAASANQPAASSSSTSTASSGSSASAASSSSQGSAVANQAQQLLNYLLAP
jgi:virulence factor Mce-like protein